MPRRTKNSLHSDEQLPILALAWWYSEVARCLPAHQGLAAIVAAAHGTARKNTRNHHPHSPTGRVSTSHEEAKTTARKTQATIPAHRLQQLVTVSEHVAQRWRPALSVKHKQILSVKHKQILSVKTQATIPTHQRDQ